MRNSWILLPFMIIISSQIGYAQQNQDVFHVSPEGDDQNPGTREQPFQTIGKATEFLQAGDMCILEAGTYREAVRIKNPGTASSPVVIKARDGAHVNLTGTVLVNNRWEPDRNGIFRVKWTGDVKQVFCDGVMMVEARWPNMRYPEDLWSCSKWAHTTRGSYHGNLACEELKDSKIDWNGATLVLNGAHQFFTWNKTVRDFDPIEGSFKYDTLDYVQGNESNKHQYERWEDDRFYLVGKYEALDAPCEWFFDREKGYLYIYTPDSGSPNDHTVEVRIHDRVLVAENLAFVEFENINMQAGSFLFRNCNHMTLRNCHFRQSTYGYNLMEKIFVDFNIPLPDVGCFITGDHNSVIHCCFADGQLSGLHIRGEGNLVENSIFHDFSWDVSLSHVPLYIFNTSTDPKSDGNIIRKCTFYNSGSVCVWFQGYNNVLEYSEAYGGLMARCGGSHDGSMVYTQRPNCRGTVIRYNWVHDAVPGIEPGRELRWGGGIGIRGDDRTRQIEIHHNVVWNIGGCGIVVKGDENLVYNNTILNIGRPDREGANDMLLAVYSESIAPHYIDKTTPALEVQNSQSLVFNNVFRNITGGWSTSDTLSQKEGHIFNNYIGTDPMITDFLNQNFMPRHGSSLIDAGVIMDWTKTPFSGKAPDIGAYEFGGDYWVPGADWKDEERMFSNKY